MIPSTLSPVLDEIIKKMSKPKTLSVRSFGSQVERNILADYEPPVFEPASYDHMRPQTVGRIGDHEIRLDPLLKFPRMTVSKKFRDALPELADDLQKWMGEFFGHDYPVYSENKVILMHPEALQRLQQKLTGRP